MFYPFPKKIQLAASQAKWQLQSTQSVLVLVGVQQLKSQTDFNESILEANLLSLSKKAKALDIPVIDLNTDQSMYAMMQLGEFLSEGKQIIIAGLISPMLKQLIQHMSSISEQICIVNDAIVLDSQQQHIQWIANLTEQHLHHMNVQSVLRLWSLSAPTDYVLSEKGILLAIAEHLELEPLEIDPYRSLRAYGLDSIAMMSLIGLWRANGADIQYEFFAEHDTLAALLTKLKG